ncbi:MAG: hypothetical protein HYX61_09390 [Gammaproteobacteria bacterium]|jgi:hypothetical protein|nr:hypothetical protein [Gammaproteobacteria bacterium]
MEDYAPIPMQKRWKDRFFSYHLRHFQDLIINHERKIEVACSSVVTPVFSRLNTATFWKDLKSHSKKKKEIDKTHDIWEKIKPLAHLNSKQLLSLLQNEILPLESIYQQSLKLFEDEKVIVDANH